MFDKLLNSISKHRLLRAGDRLGVAVSGGADSVALLLGICEIRERLGIIPSVIHVHHGLRAEADEDCVFVKTLANTNKLEFHVLRADVRELASNKRLSLETAGRQIRYEYFRSLITSGIVDKVATAHTFDDQAETVLMRILRGAGPDGLSGVFTSVERGRIIRPLLGVRRSEIEAFLRERNQCWREDLTNQDTAFTRNRVRHELLPLLERDFNPNVRNVLADAAEISVAEQQWWNDEIARVLPGLQLSPDAQLDLFRFNELHVAVQRRVLRKQLLDAGQSCDFATIERWREFLNTGCAGAHPLNGELESRIVRERSGHLQFHLATRKAATDPVAYSYSLTLPGEVRIAERGSILEAREIERVSAAGAVCLSASLRSQILTIRPWRAGDRYQPAGRGEEKLKRFFQEYKIPQNERESWPVAEFGGKIIWVLGLPPSYDHVSLDGTGLLIVERRW